MLWLRLLWLSFKRRPVWIIYVDGEPELAIIRYALPGVVVLRCSLTFGEEEETTAIIPTDTIVRVLEQCVSLERARLETVHQMELNAEANQTPPPKETNEDDDPEPVAAG
jgi:hypothetical protein